MINFTINKDNFQIKVRVNFTNNPIVCQKELSYFSNLSFKGFFRPQQVSNNDFDFYGNAGITVAEKLKGPIDKQDFFLLIEQVVNITKRLQKDHILWNKVIWDVNKSFINETTKELQLIYLPIEDINSVYGSVMDYISNITYSSHPLMGNDTLFISRFADYIKSIGWYDPEKIEAYIENEKRNLKINSGFLTDKQQDYYNHYSAQENDEATGLLYEDDEDTGLLIENDESTCLLAKDEHENENEIDEEGTSLLVGDVHYPTLFRVSTEERVAVDKPVFRIGKERSYVDYFVSNNSAVSRSHADIVTRGSQYFIIDLNSKNKTFVNNQIIPTRFEIEIFDGDRIRLGNEEFIFIM